MTAEEFLIERRILIKDAKTFPINLSRDTHIHTKNEIIKAMDDFCLLHNKDLEEKLKHALDLIDILKR